MTFYLFSIKLIKKMSDYGIYLKYALRYNHTSKEVSFPGKFPFNIELKIFKMANIDWHTLSKKHFQQYLNTKSFKIIMKRLNVCHNRSFFNFIKPFYVKSVFPNDLIGASRKQIFIYNIYKYNLENYCLDKICKYMNNCTKEILLKSYADAIEILGKNNIELSLDFIIKCLSIGIPCKLKKESVTIIIEKIWKTRETDENYLKVLITFVNTLFKSVENKTSKFINTKDLKLLFLVFATIVKLSDDAVETIIKIMNKINSDPSKQLIIAMETILRGKTIIPQSNDFYYVVFLYDFIVPMIKNIKNVSQTDCVKILDCINSLDIDTGGRISREIYYIVGTHPPILKAMTDMGNMGANGIDLKNNEYWYMVYCDAQNKPLKNWDYKLYFKNCNNFKKYKTLDKKDILGNMTIFHVNCIFNYTKYMIEEEIKEIIEITDIDKSDSPDLSVSIYGMYKIFENAIINKTIKPTYITDWVINYIKKYGEAIIYNKDFIKIFKYVHVTKRLAKTISNLPNNVHYRLGRADISYLIYKTTSLKYNFRLDEEWKYKGSYDDLNVKIIHLILKNNNRFMINKLFKDCTNVDVIHLRNIISEYNKNNKTD